ncbi:TadE family type IV pilus minor pilin [Streptomyces sp. NPDC051569]|uniref:TadE family type IV pilus minor pilin n=1 Tax=Streptomyces sp. NPDC051569 TaxID=3365661 RepID=UPI0037B4CCCA
MRSSEADLGPPRRTGRRPGGDRGTVTAEAAVAVPALLVFALALIWALTAASAQIRCVDAARAGARAAARSEPRAGVLAAARSAAPEDARITLGRTGDLWQVRVEAPTPGPGALALTLTAEAAASAEDVLDPAGPAAPADAVGPADTVADGTADPGAGEAGP